MKAAPGAGRAGLGRLARPCGRPGVSGVENVPCARGSVLYGASGSAVAGSGHFLLTGRVRRLHDVAVGAVILVTIGCWFHCKYNYAKLRTCKELREKELNKRFYMKVPTLVLNENKPTATAANEQRPRRGNPNTTHCSQCEQR